MERKGGGGGGGRKKESLKPLKGFKLPTVSRGWVGDTDGVDEASLPDHFFGDEGGAIGAADTEEFAEHVVVGLAD